MWMHMNKKIIGAKQDRFYQLRKIKQNQDLLSNWIHNFILDAITRKCPNHNCGLVETAGWKVIQHYSDVIMSASVSQITGVLIVCTTVCSDASQIKHQSSAAIAFVRGIHRWPANFPHKGPATRKMFPFDDVIMFPLFHMNVIVYPCHKFWIS